MNQYFALQVNLFTTFQMLLHQQMTLIVAIKLIQINEVAPHYQYSQH